MIDLRAGKNMSRKIVTIDDSEIAQNLIAAKLEELGYQDITRFTDPTDALASIEAGTLEADILLIDILMPKIDGIELCALIRQVPGWEEIPIIMLTSLTESSSLLQAFIAGANDYVTKPFDEIELYARMRSCLRLKAEMDRRHFSDAYERAQRRVDEVNPNIVLLPSTKSATGANDLLCRREEFEASLRVISPESLPKLGLAALRINQPSGIKTLEHHEIRLIANQVGVVLSTAPGYCGDLLTQWDEDTFCIAANATNAEDFTKRVEELVALIDLAGITTAGQDHVTISAGVCLPGAAQSAAAGLGDALREVSAPSITGTVAKPPARQKT
jgi:phosphoserine phosphatase RsbU/P